MDRRLLPALAVALTGALHLAWPHTGLPRAPFVVGAVLAWGSWVAWRAWHDPDLLHRWGFGRGDLRPSVRYTTIVTALGAAGIISLASIRGLPDVPWWIVFPLALYPLWGIVQQFLVQALVAEPLASSRLGPVGAVAVAATLFGLVHWPDPILVGATFLLGLAFTPIYLRWRNLWPLGIAHGVLGTLLYYLVLDHDPWRAFFVA